MRSTAAVIAAALLSLTAAHAQSGPELPPGPNRDLVYGQCRTCHDLQYLKESAGIPRSAWNDIIDSMRQYGLRIQPEQRAKILDYLATYLGPNPPPKAAEQTERPAAPSGQKIDAAALFGAQCSACHQANGQGVAGQFPPLAGNRDLFLNREFPARVLLAGLDGKIQVEGKTYDAVMPSFAHLSNAEIAALVRYVRRAWANDRLRPPGMQSVQADAVAELRQHEATPSDVRTIRERLKAKSRN